MLAGLSRLYIFRMPPDFWASAGMATAATASATAAAFHQRTNCIMCYSPFQQARLDTPVAREDSTRCCRPASRSPQIQDRVRACFSTQHDALAFELFDWPRSYTDLRRFPDTSVGSISAT